MFGLVHDCCEFEAKKLLEGVYVEDLIEKVDMATVNVMERILQGERPKKLSSYCYWLVYWELHSPQLQLEEQAISLDEYLRDKRND